MGTETAGAAARSSANLSSPDLSSVASDDFVDQFPRRSGSDAIRMAEAEHPGERQADDMAHHALRGETLVYVPTSPSICFSHERRLPDDLSRDIRAARPGGVPLAPNVRDDFENRFQAPLRDVRVHTDGVADDLTSAVQARAFTYDTDIFFRRGAIEGMGGRGVLAHEIGHVLQQRHTGPLLQRTVEPGLPPGTVVETLGRKRRRGIIREHDPKWGYRVRIDDPKSTRHGASEWYRYRDLDLPRAPSHPPAPQPATSWSSAHAREPAPAASRKRKYPTPSSRESHDERDLEEPWPGAQQSDRREKLRDSDREPQRKKRKHSRGATANVAPSPALSAPAAVPPRPARRERNELTPYDMIDLERFYSKNWDGGGALQARAPADAATFQLYMQNEVELVMAARTHKENEEPEDSPFLSMTVDRRLAAEADSIGTVVGQSANIGRFRVPARQVVQIAEDKVSEREGEVLLLLAPGETLGDFLIEELPNEYIRLKQSEIRAHHDAAGSQGRRFTGLDPSTWQPRYEQQPWAELRDTWDREDAEAKNLSGKKVKKKKKLRSKDRMMKQAQRKLFKNK